ncbi:MAG: lamin tail domain-containing protein [bacterium]|nr:lamin tail domain-containing protein [bacterium]
MSFPKAIILTLLFIFQTASAQVSISEIMYDLSGTDTGREWLEITNSGSGSVTVATSTWKFFEADTNHSLSLFQGSVVIPSGGFAVIVDNPQKFLLDWPQFSGTIFDSVFSLGNTGEVVALKSATSTVVDEVAYASSMGAVGDGNSLQKVGSVWMTLSPTPGSANQSGQGADSGGGSGNSPATTTPDTTSSDEDYSSEEVSASGGGKTSWPVEPQIVSRIVGPSVAIAGADVVFRGEAVGLDKKPIKNIRYLWNFGDGATKEGESVMHAYNFPAEYVVILEASSGNFLGSSRVRVKIVPADIIVGEVVSGLDGKIELVNKAKQELDLSWWRVRSGNQFFTLPKNTKILPAGHLPLSSSVIGFPVVDTDVALLYPNGSLAYKYEKVGSADVPISIAISVPEVEPTVSEMPKVSVLPEDVPESDNKPVSAIPISSAMLAQTASVASAAILDKSDATDSNVVSASIRPSLWLYGVGGVIILGLGFALFPRPVEKFTEPKSVADEYSIVED